MLLLVLLQQFVGVVADLFADVGVLDVEVVVARNDVGDRHLPGLFGLHARGKAVGLVAPPVDLGFEFLEAHGLGLVVALHAFGIGVLVVPDVLGGPALGEEQQVGLDAGVGIEHAVGQADDGVQVALFQQGLLEAGLHAFAEQKAIGQDHGGAALVLEQLDDEGHEQVRRFARAQVGGEVVLDAVFFHAAKRRVGDDDVDAVRVAVVFVGAGQSVVVADVGGRVDAVQDHVGDGQHVRQGLFLDATNGLDQRLFVFLGFDVVRALVVDGAGEKAAGAAGGIEHDFVQLRVDAVDDEPGEGARGVELARVAGALQVAQDLLVDAAEGVAVARVVEVDFADLVDDLAHQRAGLHVVVGVFEHAADDAGALARRAVGDQLFLQRRKELVIDEVRSGPRRSCLPGPSPNCASAGARAAGICSRLRGVPARLRGRRRS